MACWSAWMPGEPVLTRVQATAALLVRQRWTSPKSTVLGSVRVHAENEVVARLADAGRVGRRVQLVPAVARPEDAVSEPPLAMQHRARWHRWEPASASGRGWGRPPRAWPSGAPSELRRSRAELARVELGARD